MASKKKVRTEGTAAPENQTTGAQLISHQRALEEAVIAFVRQHDRMPDWDRVFFRGAHSTMTTVIEIWEEA